MLTNDDIRQIEQRGSSVQTVEEQVERFKKGFPWMKIVAPATPEKGILVLDDEALMQAIPKLGAVVIDTWNHEPFINQELLEMVDIATPHIAGYSYQGKQNGTASAVQSVARHFGITQLYDYYPEADIPDHDPIHLDLKDNTHGERAAVFQYNYPIFTDDFRFRMEPDKFEKLRSEYQYRREIYIE